MLSADWAYLRKVCGHHVVTTNGCFDPLEVHHCHLLREAARIGRIVVALNTDASITALKQRSPRRPFAERAVSLLSFRRVVAVVGFSDSTPIPLYSKLKPDFLVRGGAKIADEPAHNYGGCAVVIVPILLDEDGTILSSTGKASCQST